MSNLLIYEFTKYTSLQKLGIFLNIHTIYITNQTKFMELINFPEHLSIGNLSRLLNIKNCKPSISDSLECFKYLKRQRISHYYINIYV